MSQNEKKMLREEMKKQRKIEKEQRKIEKKQREEKEIKEREEIRKTQKIKVEVGDYDHFDGKYNFIVHYKGEKVHSFVKLAITINDFLDKYSSFGYDTTQFNNSVHIFVKHKDIERIKTIKQITHQYFFEGAKTPIIQAQEISDWLDDNRSEWDDDWKFEDDNDEDDEDDKVEIKDNKDDDE